MKNSLPLLLDLERPRGNLISGQVHKKELDKLLLKELRSGVVGEEQWYRNDVLWHRLKSAPGNPYGNSGCDSEYDLVKRSSDKFSKLIRNYTQVFLGVGTGESELEVVKAGLSTESYLEVIAVDVNREFISDFAKMIRRKVILDDCVVMFKGLNSLFQSLNEKSFQFCNKKNARNIFICFGNTVGNYVPQHLIFSIFEKISNRGDRLFLGFQLNNNIEKIYKKYSDCALFFPFMTNFISKPDSSKVRWNLNKELTQIEAYYEKRIRRSRGFPKRTQLFRSRKYDSAKISKELEPFGFKKIWEKIDDQEIACIQIYERKS